MGFAVEKLERLYERTSALDFVLAKVLGISEVARTARIEVNLRRFLLTVWDKRQKEAETTAVEMARKLEPHSKITRAIADIMEPWAKDVTPRFISEFERIYYLARRAGWRKVTGRTRASLARTTPKFEEPPSVPLRKLEYEALPSFDVVDRGAVEALTKHQVFWIGRHYKRNVSPTIARTTREAMIEAGRRPSVAARLMRERVRRDLSWVQTPPGFVGTKAQYFEGLVSNAATVGHVHGQMRSFVDFGVAKYEITNPSDKRTCDVCQHMNGKIFSVDQGTKVMEAELAAETPEQVKAAHPFKGHLPQVQKISPNPGPQGPEDAQKLSEGGFSLPPFHFRCRCTVDVSFEAGSFVPPIEPPKVPTPPGVKKPKAPQPKQVGGRPGQFPPMKRHSTRPMSLFSATRMTKALGDTTRKGSLKLTTEAQATVRRELNAICAEFEMTNSDVLLEGMSAHEFEVARKISGARGQHWPVYYKGFMDGGKIKVTKETVDSTKAFLAGERTTKATQGMHTCLHEVTHAHSKHHPTVYSGAGKILEEATVTMATESMMVEKFGMEWGDAFVESYYQWKVKVRDVVAGAMKKVVGDKFPNAYGWWLESTRSAKGHDWGPYQVAAKAAVKMRKTKTIAKTYGKYQAAFIRQIELPPELTTGLKADEVKKLTTAVRREIRKKLKDELMKAARGI